MFGECVLGFLKSGDKKAAPRWQKGIWLGKSLTNDTHIIAQGNDVFVTRSIRRLPTPFVLEALGDMVACPWSYGYAALGHRMVYSRQLSPPMPFGVGSGLPPAGIDAEAIQVQRYAEEHPNEDLDAPELGEAGPRDAVEGPKPVEMDVQSSSAGHKRLDADSVPEDEAAKRQRIGLEQPMTPDDQMLAAGERSPKAPRLAESPKRQMMNQVTSTDLSLYEHEDDAVRFQFEDDELDRLEQYDFEFEDDEWLVLDELSADASFDLKNAIKELSYPYGPTEPDVSDEQLRHLDGLADQVELQRLTKLGVLQDPDSVPADSKVLSTRFVRTWREKRSEDGSPIWLRRSRFVAREFAWLEPERESLFSPASGSIISRVLPTMFLQMRESRSCVLMSLDVRDAFLTVKQQCPTLVHTTDAGGSSKSFALGRVLPGQRDGSLLWYQDITGFLKSELDMIEYTPYPCVLATKDGSCAVMVHVDDMLVVGCKSFVLGKFMDVMRSKYDISKEVLEKPGDQITFLKRNHVLHEDGRLTIQTHHKHVAQMCSLLGINHRTQNKKNPGHADMDKEDDTDELPAAAGTTFRTCVGILMYLANDLPHCQHVIRYLSTHNTKPTAKSLAVLKHLVAYLACHGDICISLKWTGRCSGVFHGYPHLDPTENILEVYTDSDWASDKATRRSVSCCVLMYGGCLLYSASRTQRIVSLSSAEAEVYACSSGTSDAILLARLISWLTSKKTTIFLYTDSSGAKGILQRRGSDDPGRVFTRRPNVRALISALSLLQLQGCDASISASVNFGDNSWMVMFFTLVLGLLMLLPFAFSWFSARAATSTSLVHQQDNVEQVQDAQTEPGPAQAEPAPEPVPLWGGVNLASIPQFETEADVPAPGQEWSPEALTVFMFERCQRRYEAAQSVERRVLYSERLTVLRGIMQTLRNSLGPERLRASQLVMDMNDISEDETSPLHRATLEERDAAIRESGEAHAWVAQNFIEGTGSDRDHAEEEEEEGSDADESMESETASQRLRRYLRSEMCEVSDPDEWCVLHYGAHTPESSSDDET
eukprot:s97_g14.t1